MIKLLIFDLDGVLISSKESHFKALNDALKEIDPTYIISEEEHVNRYDGLPTKEKLKMLTKEKGLPENLHEQIYTRKQFFTSEEAKLININVK